MPGEEKIRRFIMPEKLERCVRKVMKTVKPRAGSTKRESAWAICTKSTKQKRHRNINRRGKK